MEIEVSIPILVRLIVKRYVRGAASHAEEVSIPILVRLIVKRLRGPSPSPSSSCFNSNPGSINRQASRQSLQSRKRLQFVSIPILVRLIVKLVVKNLARKEYLLCRFNSNPGSINRQ